MWKHAADYRLVREGAARTACQCFTQNPVQSTNTDAIFFQIYRQEAARKHRQVGRLPSLLTYEKPSSSCLFRLCQHVKDFTINSKLWIFTPLIWINVSNICTQKQQKWTLVLLLLIKLKKLTSFSKGINKGAAASLFDFYMSAYRERERKPSKWPFPSLLTYLSSAGLPEEGAWKAIDAFFDGCGGFVWRDVNVSSSACCKSILAAHSTASVMLVSCISDEYDKTMRAQKDTTQKDTGAIWIT